jgi:hypothetical protein
VASEYRSRCKSCTTKYAEPKITPYSPKAPGTASEATNKTAIEQKITSRAGMTSSAGTALVSHE